ncbi:heme-binding protein [Hyphococcus lacteus]|uniref:Heme-binding protein n=1 Tax=Hyphococcus lacteus TaxID=3143536 RepID=A0ABV3Z0C7_9PROT
MRSLFLGVACLGVSFSGAFAQSLNAEQAQSIIAGCSAFALDNGRSHAIAVYDPGASPIAVLRMNGNSAGAMLFSMEKAKAVAMWGFATSGMEEGVKNTPGFQYAPGVVTVPGGVPVYSSDGRTFLGAAAASGEAPANDVACVEAGIKSAGFSYVRNRE